jgi:peptidoglycan hydrolase-like protein with peptidoglycan-binding domain
MIYGSALGLMMIGLDNVPVEAGSGLPGERTIAQLMADTPVNRPILRIGSEGVAVSELQAALKLLGYYSDVVDGFYRESTASAVSGFQQAAGLTPDGITGPATWNRLFPSTPTVVSTSPLPSINPAPVRTSPLPSTNPTSVRTSPASSNNPASSFPVPTIIQSTNTNERVNQQAPEEPSRPRQTNRPNRSQAASTSSSSSSTANPQATAVTLPILRQGMQGPAVVQLQERLKTLGFLKEAVDGVFGEATQAAVQAAQQKFNLAPDGVVGPTTWRALLR